jgi:HD superfamily phosphohydrolase
VESAPRAYKLKASNAAPPISTFTVTSRIASRIFDIVTAPENVYHDSVRNIIPDAQARSYWKSVLRMAALCHDVGHLPFSHAAEKELLPEGYDHERLTKDVIYSAEMEEIWKAMTPPLRSDHIVKLAVGPKKAAPLELDTWETVLAEIIIGDALGADRMDYLLRDSYHAGVADGTFDRHRLINTLRILPARYEESDEPSLGLEAGGLESSEGLMIARHFMYKQVYLHDLVNPTLILPDDDGSDLQMPHWLIPLPGDRGESPGEQVFRPGRRRFLAPPRATNSAALRCSAPRCG